MGGNHRDFHPFPEERVGNYQVTIQWWKPSSLQRIRRPRRVYGRCTPSWSRFPKHWEKNDEVYMNQRYRRRDIRHWRMSLSLRTVSNTWNWSDDVHLEGDVDFPRSLKVYLALSLPLFVREVWQIGVCLWTLTCHQDFAEGVPRVQH